MCQPTYSHVGGNVEYLCIDVCDFLFGECNFGTFWHVKSQESPREGGDHLYS